MTTTDMLGRVRERIEDELGEFRHFAGLPAAELERIAERLARAIMPLVAQDPAADQRDAA